MLAVLIPALLAVTLVVAACGGEQTATTTTAPAVTPPTPAAITTAAADETAVAMFRANLERTGVFPSGGPSQLPKLVWKFQTTSADWMEYVSSPAVSDGVVYFTDITYVSDSLACGRLCAVK